MILRKSRAAPRQLKGPAILTLITDKSASIMAHFYSLRHRASIGLKNRGPLEAIRGRKSGSSAASIAWPRFRHDTAEIADRHSPIKGPNSGA